jgi:hypothetical protein
LSQLTADEKWEMLQEIISHLIIDSEIVEKQEINIKLLEFPKIEDISEKTKQEFLQNGISTIEMKNTFSKISATYDFKIPTSFGNIFLKLWKTERIFAKSETVLKRYYGKINEYLPYILDVPGINKNDLWIYFIKNPDGWHYVVIPIFKSQLEDIQKYREKIAIPLNYKYLIYAENLAVNKDRTIDFSELQLFLMWWKGKVESKS